MFTRRRSMVFAVLVLGFTLYFLLVSPQEVYAMHIMEGFLPLGWAVFWWLLFIPFFALGVRRLIRITREHPELKLMMGLAGAFTFVLSALKLPSVTGSSSHPTGTGLGAIMLGPLPMSVIGSIVLLFQAVLLAHGGLTTLGANAFSMAVAGPFAGYAVYKLLMKGKGRENVAVFSAAAVADMTTYLVTSLQLALAFPSAQGGVLASLVKFGGVFAITQLPLAITEGLLTVLLWNWLKSYSPHELSILSRHERGARQI